MKFCFLTISTIHNFMCIWLYRICWTKKCWMNRYWIICAERAKTMKRIFSILFQWGNLQIFIKMTTFISKSKSFTIDARLQKIVLYEIVIIQDFDFESRHFIIEIIKVKTKQIKITNYFEKHHNRASLSNIEKILQTLIQQYCTFRLQMKWTCFKNNSSRLKTEASNSFFCCGVHRHHFRRAHRLFCLFDLKFNHCLTIMFRIKFAISQKFNRFTKRQLLKTLHFTFAWWLKVGLNPPLTIFEENCKKMTHISLMFWYNSLMMCFGFFIFFFWSLSLGMISSIFRFRIFHLAQSAFKVRWL